MLGVGRGGGGGGGGGGCVSKYYSYNILTRSSLVVCELTIIIQVVFIIAFTSHVPFVHLSGLFITVILQFYFDAFSILNFWLVKEEVVVVGGGGGG